MTVGGFIVGPLERWLGEPFCQRQPVSLLPDGGATAAFSAAIGPGFTWPRAHPCCAGRGRADRGRRAVDERGLPVQGPSLAQSRAEMVAFQLLKGRCRDES